MKYLNVSGNKLFSLREIKYFGELLTLEAKDNLIEDLEDLAQTVGTLEKLENLFLQGNPVTKICRYRENVIANSSFLS